MTDSQPGRDWLAMSNDNTPEGRQDAMGSGGPITLVQPGMQVVDAAGKDFGKVESMRMGDPTAVTVDSAPDDNDNILDEVTRAILMGPNELPGSTRDQLLRGGYLYVDGKGFIFDKKYYVAADQIARVEGDKVYLTLNHDQVIEA